MSAANAPRGAGTGESLNPAVAGQLLADGGQLVDIRAPADFERDALPGAVNLPVDALAWEFRRLNRRRPVILCGAGDCRCTRAARLLAGAGFSRIYYLDLDQQP